MVVPAPSLLFFFFFNDTATTEIYTLSLHDALPIYSDSLCHASERGRKNCRAGVRHIPRVMLCQPIDRKSTRLNSSHLVISYAVFCLKKKNTLWIELNVCKHDLF